MIVAQSFAGCFEVPVSCLKAPGAGRCLREPDPLFTSNLKKEIVENPTKLVSPIVGLVCLKPDEQYDHRHANSYMYETIGGNNGRIAVQELAEGNQNDLNYKTRFVAVTLT